MSRIWLLPKALGRVPIFNGINGVQSSGAMLCYYRWKAAIGRIIVSLTRRSRVGVEVIVGWIDWFVFLIRWWEPWLVIISVQPWSAMESREVPIVSGNLIKCWVERGVRNHREVMIVWGKCGRGCCGIVSEKTIPPPTPIKRARTGPLAARIEIGARVVGGIITQFNVAPQMIAANESIPVGIVNKSLVLWRFRRGGCCLVPNWLIMVARAV